MKCVHCEYEYGWSAEKLDCVQGEHGQFFELPIDFERIHCCDEQEVKTFACPACKKIFIDF